jgi:uncharacterized membrane protein (DUF485 family)
MASTDPELIKNLNKLNQDYQNPNFMSNNPKEYEFLNNVKSSVLSNYENNIMMSQTITSNIESLKGQFEHKIKKIDDLSQRQLEINRFYILKYKKEIELLQRIVLICGIGLVGCLLYNIGLISNNFLSLYLGIVLSIGFIVIFYSLWDIYIRDNNVFDEYDYGVYGSEQGTNIVPENVNKYEYNNLKC